MQQSDFARLLDNLDASRSGAARTDGDRRRRWHAVAMAAKSPLIDTETGPAPPSIGPRVLTAEYEAHMTAVSGQQQASATWLMEEFNAALALLSGVHAADPARASAIRRHYAKRCHPDILPRQLRGEANRLLAEINIRAQTAKRSNR